MLKRILAPFALMCTWMMFLHSGCPSPCHGFEDRMSYASMIQVTDLEKDPGYFFLLAEDAEARGDQESTLKYLRKSLTLDPTSAYLQTRIASVLARSRKIAEALMMTRLAIIFEPNFEPAYTLLGKIYTVTNDRSRAAECYGKALELKPDDRDLYIFLGSLQASQDLFEDAEQTFERMISQFPDEKEGMFYLAKVYVEAKKYDKAIDLFRQIVDKQDGAAQQAYLELGTVYSLQKNYPEAEKCFKEAIKLDPFNITARLKLGQILADQKKFPESYTVFEELSKLAPSNLGIQIRMALILAEQKQFDRAKEMLDRVLQAKPGWDQARFQLGRVLKEQGKLEDAEKEFLAIQKGQPTFVNSRVMLSLMFLRKRNYDKALRYIDETILPDTTDTDLLEIKASILEELYRLDEAIAIYKKALEIDAKDFRIRYALGNCLEKSGRRSQGLQEMEKILADRPDDPGALNFIGYTLVSSSADMERGELLIKRALELKPEDGYILDSMAWVLHKKGNNQEALPYLEQAVQKVPLDPIIFDHLGDVQAALNLKERAAESYRKSLSVNPDNILVQQKLRKIEQELSVPSE